MKTYISIFALVLITSLEFSLSVNLKINKENQVPKAKDLKNHYGVNSIKSPYAENNFDVKYFAKENAEELNTSKEKPNLNEGLYEYNESNAFIPYNVKSGKLTNVAKAAKELVNPQKADPTLVVDTTVNYPKVVEYAEFKGFKNQIKNVNVLDKKSNTISKKNVLVSVPIYKRERQVAVLPTKLTAKINLETQKLIEPVESEKKLLGIDRE